MRFRSLETRIVTLFLVLILAVQLAGFLAIRSGIDGNARAAIRAELKIAERVFLRLLDQNAQKLTQGARLLAADYGFKQAVASNDRETISSALANHGARIGASLTLLIGPDRLVKASTAEHTPETLAKSILALVDQTEEGGKASTNAVEPAGGGAGQGTGHHRLGCHGLPGRQAAGGRHAGSVRPPGIGGDRT
jgi:hypothetical protein